MNPSGCFPAGIFPGNAAEAPASGRTPAPAAEPDGKKQFSLLCLVFLNTLLFGILGCASCLSNLSFVKDALSLLCFQENMMA